MIGAADDLEMLAPATLSIVCFRYAPAALRDDSARLDALNKAIMEAVQAGGEAFLTQTAVRGRFSLRACVVHYATTEADLKVLLDAVREVGARLAPT
jgi:glutamate/tyrosine decarboxylase-like PLP-dependent enzyme